LTSPAPLPRPSPLPFADHFPCAAQTIARAIHIATTGEFMLIPDINPAPVCKRSQTGTALKRCRDAWQRAYDAVYAESIEGGEDEEDSIEEAQQAASMGYCSALPVLFDQDGIGNFISCVAHGVLIRAIDEDVSGRLLYAAQVAISALPRQPRGAKPLKKPRTPPPSPQKTSQGNQLHPAT
jgi:hypothetical protein